MSALHRFSIFQLLLQSRLLVLHSRQLLATIMHVLYSSPHDNSSSEGSNDRRYSSKPATQSSPARYWLGYVFLITQTLQVNESSKVIVLAFGASAGQKG
jgi:hypothetical protein